MNFRLRLLIVVLGLAFGLTGLAACSENALTEKTPQAETIQAFKAEPTTNNGNARRGVQVFGRLPCLTCHTLAGSGDTKATAPSLDKIGINAATRLPGVTAAQYLRHAVTKPEDLNLPNFKNIMPGFGSSLTPTELEDLVAHLLSLN